MRHFQTHFLCAAQYVKHFSIFSEFPEDAAKVSSFKWPKAVNLKAKINIEDKVTIQNIIDHEKLNVPIDENIFIYAINSDSVED